MIAISSRNRRPDMACRPSCLATSSRVGRNVRRSHAGRVIDDEDQPAGLQDFPREKRLGQSENEQQQPEICIKSEMRCRRICHSDRGRFSS